jgi:hypothetical protein
MRMWHLCSIPCFLFFSQSHFWVCVLQVQPLIELFDTELPFNRVPMHDKVQELAAGRLACGLPGSPLNSQPLAELHPASW